MGVILSVGYGRVPDRHVGDTPPGMSWPDACESVATLGWRLSHVRAAKDGLPVDVRTEPLRLGHDEFSAHCVHRHPVREGVHRDEQARDADPGVALTLA